MLSQSRRINMVTRKASHSQQCVGEETVIYLRVVFRFDSFSSTFLSLSSRAFTIGFLAHVASIASVYLL